MTDGGVGRPSIDPSVEPFAIRWKRRAVTIPTMLGVTAAAIVLSPLLAVAAVAYDIARLGLGSVFIPRDQGARAQQAIARLAASLTGQSAVVIFPEGRGSTPIGDGSMTGSTPTSMDELPPRRTGRVAASWPGQKLPEPVAPRCAPLVSPWVRRPKGG